MTPVQVQMQRKPQRAVLQGLPMPVSGRVSKELISLLPAHCFDGAAQIGEFMLHPDDTLQMPKDHAPAVFWMYQNTIVNMTELTPILDNAMEAIAANKTAGHPVLPSLTS